MKWLVSAWVLLSTWQIFLVGVYLIYSVVKAYFYWSDFKDSRDRKEKFGLFKVYKKAIFGHSEYIKFYHIIKIVVDIPAVCIGYFFPIIKRIFSFKLYKFKSKSAA